MSVYVDKLHNVIRNPKWRYAKACHLLADSTEELHKFARKIGLRREWYQYENIPHYDLTQRKRIRAVKNGAIEINRIELSRKMVEIRSKKDG